MAGNAQGMKGLAQAGSGFRRFQRVAVGTVLVLGGLVRNQFPILVEVMLDAAVLQPGLFVVCLVTKHSGRPLGVSEVTAVNGDHVLLAKSGGTKKSQQQENGTGQIKAIVFPHRPIQITLGLPNQR